MSDSYNSEFGSDEDEGTFHRRRNWGSNASDYNEEEDEDDSRDDQNQALFQWAKEEEEKD